MVSVDMRTRLDADVVVIDPVTFVVDELPELLRLNGELAARGAALVGAKALGIDVEGTDFTLVPTAGTIELRRGTSDARVVVELDRGSFSDLVQDLQTPQTLATALVTRLPMADHFRWLKWWPVLRAIIDARPVHEPGGIDFFDRDGEHLDLSRRFTPDDSDTEMAHFLVEAGFLHLQGWWPVDFMEEISTDMDRALPQYRPDDERSWWAVTGDGSERCVRMRFFQENSPAAHDLLNDPRHLRIGALTDDGHVPRTRVHGVNAIEALVKPIDVVSGISDLPWHKDCSLGRHSYDCCAMTTGISVTGADARSGQLAVVAGSHRANVQPNFIHPYLDLPEVPLPTGTGDVTVHLSCTLHMSHAPAERERRVMYTGFSLPGERGNSIGADLGSVRENAYRNVSQTPAALQH